MIILMIMVMMRSHDSTMEINDRKFVQLRSYLRKDNAFEEKKKECRSEGKKTLIKFPQLWHVQPRDTRTLEAILDRDYC